MGTDNSRPAIIPEEIAISNPFSSRGVEFTDSKNGAKYFKGTRDQTRMIKFIHPTGQCNTCHETGLRMECGHYICPDDILDTAWGQLSNRKHEIDCTECNKHIKQDDIIKFGLPTLEEEQFLITAITTNFCKSQGIQPCPKCRSLCQRTRTDTPLVHCTVCLKKRGNLFEFCWYCLGEWNNPLNFQDCGNKDCEKALIEALINSPMKQLKYLNGNVIEIPTRRACPQCHTILEHSEGCNEFTCSLCKQEFCFICLSKLIDGSLKCGSFTCNSIGIMIRCTPAPIQTKLR